MKGIKRRNGKLSGLGGLGLSAALLLFLFFAAAIALVPTASADPGWDYYREVVIDHTKVNSSADLNSFPVLINHTADWLQRADGGDHVRRADGYDIVFTNADNSSLLDYEIEEYNGTAGTLVAWVRIPTLKYNQNTTIRLWYGNSAATDWSNPTGVWDSNYKGVWHLLGDGTTSLPDATSYSNTGTKLTATEPANTASGQIDGAQVFDGTNDYVNCGNDPSIRSSLVNLSVAMWIKAPSPSKYRGIVATAKADGRDGYRTAITPGACFQGLIGDASSYDIIDGTTSIGDNVWHYLTFTVDSSYLRIYVDAVEDHVPVTRTKTMTWDQNLTIGKYLGTYEFFSGTIDEVRISDIARSGDWIKTSYDNQNSPSTFYSVKDATATGGSDPVPELPTVILFAVGLVVLAGYIWLRRKNK